MLQCFAAVCCLPRLGGRVVKEWQSQSMPWFMWRIHRSRSPTRATTEAYGEFSHHRLGYCQPALSHTATVLLTMRSVTVVHGAKSICVLRDCKCHKLLSLSLDVYSIVVLSTVRNVVRDWAAKRRTQVRVNFER